MNTETATPPNRTTDSATKRTYVNLTTHPVTIDGVGTLPPSGVVARVRFNRVVDETHPVRILVQTTGEITNIPEPKLNTAYIVPSVVLNAIHNTGNPYKHRLDIYGLDTGPDATRERGQVTSVRGLLR